MANSAKYGVGQVVKHRLSQNRGVIIDVDANFKYPEKYYQLMPDEPDREQPWYHMLVEDTNYVTYVAEQNIVADQSGQPIEHPDIELYFSELEKGVYQSKFPAN